MDIIAESGGREGGVLVGNNIITTAVTVSSA